MTLLLLYLLASAGLTIIVTKSYIFEPIREFFYIDKEEIEYFKANTFKDKSYNKIYKLLNCPLCFGFWAGLIMYFMMGWEFEVKMWICCGFAASIFSFIVYKYIEK